MSKYTPLGNYLNRKTEDEIELNFVQIEWIIGAKLPKSAFTHTAWWLDKGSGTHVQSNAWQEVGWQVDKVDLEGYMV